MKTSWIVLILAIIVVIGGVVWWESSANPTGGPSATTSAAGGGTTVTTTSTTTTTAAAPIYDLELGTDTSAAIGGAYLTAGNGITLYEYDKDAPNVSACTGTCALTWLPYTVSSAAGLTVQPPISGTIGTITRTDGSLQVTYDQHPLYFYVSDRNPGDVTGEGVGGVWHVAKP